MSMEYAAAIDLSGRFGGIALQKGKEVLLAESRPMRGRDSAVLAAWIAERLAAVDVELDQVRSWTVGSGPGSFTGMRLAAALVAGWTFEREGVETRCVPTAVALASRITSAPGETIGCLFDGRNRELIYFQVENRDGEPVPTGRTAVLNHEQAAVFFAAPADRHWAALAVELPALEPLLPEALFPHVAAVAELDLTALIRSSYRAYDNDLTDLVYIRPAVFTAPIS